MHEIEKIIGFHRIYGILYALRHITHDGRDCHHPTGPCNQELAMTAGEGGRPANINAISTSQASYIQKNFLDATLYPPGSQPGGAIPSEFFYRDGHLLMRDRDLRDVLNTLVRVAPRLTINNTRLERAEATSRPIPGLTLVKLIFSQDPEKDPE